MSEHGLDRRRTASHAAAATIGSAASAIPGKTTRTATEIYRRADALPAPGTDDVSSATLSSSASTGDHGTPRRHATAVHAVSTSIELAAAILASGRDSALAQVGTGQVIPAQAQLLASFVRASSHLARSEQIASTIDPGTLADDERGALQRSLGRLHVEIDASKTATMASFLPMHHRPELRRLVAAESGLRAGLGLDPTDATIEGPVLDVATGADQALEATTAHIEELARGVLIAADREASALVPALTTQVAYAMRVVSEMPVGDRERATPLVERIGSVVSDVQARVAALGQLDAYALWSAYTSLRVVAGLAPPEAPVLSEPSPSQERIARAYGEIATLRARLDAVIESTRAWLVHNFAEFFKYTSQNPHIAWTEGAFGSLVSNAIGNLFTEVGKDIISKGAGVLTFAALGSAFLPGVGTVIGFVIGVLVETLASEAFDWLTGAKDADEHAAEAAHRAGGQVQTHHAAFTASAAATRAKLHAQLEVLMARIGRATTDREVASIEHWARRETQACPRPIPSSDLSLAVQMMREWVLQHAGDEEDANSETSSAQWNATRERAGFGDQIEKRRDLFVHQTTYHLSRMGFDPREIEAARRKMETTVGDRDLARSSRYRFSRIASVEAFANMLAGHSQFRLNALGRRGIETGALAATLTLDLAEAEGSVYVDSWDYDLEFADQRAGFDVWSTLTYLSMARTKLSVSPD